MEIEHSPEGDFGLDADRQWREGVINKINEIVDEINEINRRLRETRNEVRQTSIFGPILY